MSSTRIEVPLTLPTPHFDDERTIATARQVKPIGRAKVSESWRRLRTLLPVILLATFCGALGAAGLNYYESRGHAEIATQPVTQNLTTPQRSEASPVAVAATTDPNAKPPDKEKEAVSVEVKTESTSAAQTQPVTPAQPDHQVSTDQPPAKSAVKPEKKSEDPDATKLTRKRRVNSPDENPTPAKKNGAGRIADIFGGPNP